MKPMGFAALFVGFLLVASSVCAESTPSLNLEGTGDLGPGPGACVAAGCTGLFTATLSGQLAGAVERGRIADESAGRESILMYLPTSHCKFRAHLRIVCPAPAGGSASAGNASPEASAKKRRRSPEPRGPD